MRSAHFLKSILRRPSTSFRAMSHLKASDMNPAVSLDEVCITALLPDNYEDFETFGKIITDENIAFTSSWIGRCFGIKTLRQKCDHTKTKLRLVAEGDTEIALPEEVMEAYKAGASPDQIALNRFFSLPANKDKLRGVYLEMTGRVEETGLGYYKFEDRDKRLLGGGALAPISEGMPVEKVDIALHILSPKQGLGSFFLDKLLTKAFRDHGVKQVWGSSIINHPGTPTLCAKHGMMIKNQDGMKYYFIDDKMYATNQDRMRIMDNPHAASTYYDRKDEKGGR